MTNILHEFLSNPRVSFLEKLKKTANNELDYWSNRDDPPNLTVEEFRQFIKILKPPFRPPLWQKRTSKKGTYGETGEDQIFSFNYTIKKFGKTIKYYCKGYFFEKGNLSGVTIQSFRRV